MKSFPKSQVARVAIDVRLYFDVLVEDTDEATVRRAAHAELQRVGDLEQIRVRQLKFPAVYPTDVWPAISTADFRICEICPAAEANKETRFAL